MDESLSSSTNEQTDPIVSDSTSDSTAMSTAEVLAPCPSTSQSTSKLQTSIEDNHTLHKSLQQYEELHTHKQVESVLDLFTVDELKLLLSSAANDNSGVRSMIFKHADSLNHSPLEALNNNNNNTNNPYQYTNAYDNYNYNNKTSSHGSSNGTPRNSSPHPNGYDHTSDTDSDHYSPFVLPAKADVGYYAYYYKNSTNVSKADFVDEADKRTTASTSSTPRGTAYFWNEQFQEISQKIQDVDLYNEEDAYEKMAHLYQDFVYVVETYARVIISERFLPMGQRSIPPAYYVGGQAGGEKYIVQGILFKFAVDKHGLYGGDNYAAKAAGHDLKSLVQCYKSRTPGLHVPMMCLVDFLGYRLIALSLLPVDRTTLCYGSCDGGQEVYNSDTDFSAKMHVLGQSLNLKEHAAGAGGKNIIGPCDIEGHKGKDNRFYLLDFARLFPPQAPMGLPRHPNEYLYKLLRPELVKSFDVPLSSDAYTLFGKRNADVHNSEVLRATEYLYNVIIPDFAKTLDSSNGTNICSSNNNNNTSNNILLRANVGEIAPRPRSMNGSMIVQAVLNSFMIHSGEEQSSEAASSSDASTASSSSSPANGSPNGNMSPGNSRNIFHSNTGFIKSLNNLRALKRRSSYSILTSIEGRDNDNKGITHEKLTELMHREGINMRHLGIMRKRVHSSHWRDSLLIEILGRVIKNTIKSKQRQKMEELRTPAVVPYKEVAISYLNLVFGDTPQSQDYWSTELVAVTEDLFEEALYHERLDGSIVNLKQRVDHLTLFRAVKRITGMMFSPHCEEHFPCGPEPFQATDLEHMPTKIKEMRIAMYASATGLYLKAKYMTDSKERDRLANIASAQFTSALRTSPDDHMILCNYALLLRLQNRFSEAKVYYKMATRQCPTSARILGHYAWFLQRDMKAFDKAEKYYKRALEVDPSHVRVLSDYGTFLFRIRSDYIQAEECFKQCVKLGYKQAFINYSMFLEHTGKPDEAQYYSELAKSAKGTMIINGKVTY